jgi:hypothetical protein
MGTGDAATAPQQPVITPTHDHTHSQQVTLTWYTLRRVTWMVFLIILGSSGVAVPLVVALAPSAVELVVAALAASVSVCL